MLRVIGNDQNLPRQEHAVASGTLTNGKPVVVNANGTVSVVAETTVTQSAGTPVTFNSGSPRVTNIAYDTNTNRVVIVYRDDGNSGHGTAVVGTVSGTSISFGSEVVFNAAETKFPTVSYDTNAQKVLVTYQDEGNSSYGTAIVGTVDSSDNSISFGSETVYKSAAVGDQASVYDPDSQKIVIAFSLSQPQAAVATISGTSVSFGSLANFGGTNDAGLSMAYDTNADKVVLAYRDGSDTQGKAVVGTVSGTSISFGSEATWESGGIDEYQDITYDASAQKVVIAYLAPSNVGKAIVGTVSGTSISFGTAATYDTVASDHNAIAYDPTAESVAIFYRDTTPFHGKAVSGKVSGTSITFTDQITFQSGRAERIAAVYDPDSAKVIVSYFDYDASTGDAVVTTTGFTSRNLTSENYIGISRSGAASGAGAIVDTQGAIAEVDTEITTTGFVISSGSYDSKSFSVASQETNPKGVFFKTDGTKMYVVGTAGGAVFQYGLSTAFDVSTASYDNVSLTDFNVVSNNRNGSGLFFHPDGTYIFIVETSNQTNLVRLTLSTPWDLSTAGSKVTNSSLPTNKASNAAQGIFFKPDGSKMYLCENRNAGTDVHGFDLSTNWDISSSSVSSDSSFETTTQDNEIGGLFLNTDGSEFYLIGYQNDKVYRYTISTPYDISTSTFADDFSVGSQENQPEAVTFKPDGTKMYIVGPTNDTVFQYSTSTSVGGPITPGQSYFVQNDGTLGTTAADPSVFAGTAVSATKLIVKG